MITTEKNDQEILWEKLIKGISGNLVNTKNIIMLSSNQVCTMDKDLETAMAQVYKIANSIVPWSITWNGTPQGDLFRSYQAFVNGITPTQAPDATKDMERRLEELSNKIASFNSKTSQIMKDVIKDYINNYCLEPGNNAYTCDTLLPGSPKIEEYLDEYKKSAEYQQKKSLLKKDYSSTLTGLQEEYNNIAQKYFGANYRQIDEAKNALLLADPDNAGNLGKTSDELLQMSINANGDIHNVAKFTVSNLEEYKHWLKTTRAAYDNAQDPSVSISFSDKIDTSSELNSSFTGNAMIPVSYFFQLNIDASGSYHKSNMDKYSYAATITYQDVFQLDLSPDKQWYFENMLSTYKDYYKDHLGALYDKKLWGAGGMLGTQISGLIIGYGSYVKIESEHWHQTDISVAAKEKISFGIGPIHFASEESSFSNKSHKMIQTDNGIELIDQSGTAKIIAVIVKTPNSNI